MKTYSSFLIFLGIGIIAVFTGSSLSAQGLPGDTLQLSFTENWNSGSFAMNGWSFPNGQGSWVVDNYYGDPTPSAAFYGFPPITNYSYKLFSPWFDGKEFQCSDIWLDFDLKLINVSITRTEEMTIGKEYDTTWIPLCTVKNDSNMGWKHYHLSLGFANKHYFKIGFIASGVNSSGIDSWHIDNIQLDYVCEPPSDLNAWHNNLADTVNLSWDPPNCGRSGILMNFIYDDGTMENGWVISQGNNGWFGNEFPVPGMSGTLESVSTLWWANTCLPSAMTIDFFDANHTLVATSDTFYTAGTWVTVQLNHFPFNGIFYAMVHWTPTTNCSYYLGYDENGPYTSQDLAWYYDGTTWQKVSSLPSGNPGVFLLRTTAMVTDGKKLTELFPADFRQNMPDVIDSMVVTGYNIYRKPPFDDSSFRKINTIPVPGTQYTDVPPPNYYFDGYYYYVTCIYNHASTNDFLCESPGSDTIYEVLVVNVGEKKVKAKLKVFPVPASNIINIQSDKIITGIEIDDHLGSIRLTEGNLREKEYSFPVERLSPGLYFLKVMTGEGIITRKILVLH